MYLFQVFFLENKLKLCIHPYTSQWNKIYTEKSVFICGHLAVGTIIVKQVLVWYSAHSAPQIKNSGAK